MTSKDDPNHEDQVENQEVESQPELVDIADVEKALKARAKPITEAYNAAMLSAGVFKDSISQSVQHAISSGLTDSLSRYSMPYRNLSEEISRIGRLAQGYTPFIDSSASKAVLKMQEAIPPIDSYISKAILNNTDYKAMCGSVAMQDIARLGSEQLFKSSLQSQAEVCKRAWEASYGNLLKEFNTLADGVNHLRAVWDAPGLIFQDSYLKAVQAVSEGLFPQRDFMLESVRRSIEYQSESITKAAQLASQGLMKDFTSGTDTALDHFQRYSTLQADLLQSAVSPFMQEWAWLVCEAKLVSVDIEHDGDHFLYAEYDRETVVELLTARLALEETQPGVSISSSGELEQPHELFNCSGEHSGHSAHYHGETILDSKDKESKKKALLQCLNELRQKDELDEETWDQLETDARRAERFTREIFADIMHIAMLYAMELSIHYVKENPLSAEDFRAHQERAFARIRELLPKPDDGRPKGTGLFRDADDFLTALKDVLGKAHKRPSQRQALHAIRQHPLCRKQTKDYPTPNQAKTLRNWLDKCGMTYEDALEKYWKPAQRGK
jgi:hypothetical protein